ncbi:SRPBCC family protein [Spongiimicrobium salis]|uniref:SRPBCC family protein n=1 Tax=Spongiimicrobium salis TaxID=1667022 RepID=UPI00374D3635
MEEHQDFSIYHDLFIKAPKEKVFQAITEPEHLNNCWPLSSSGTPAIGHEYNFNFTSDYDWYGEVVECEINTRFYIKMTKSDADWNATSFGFDIEEAREGIQLKFKHTNWKKCNAEFRQSSFCWALLLNGLKNYLEKGEIIPFQERA